MEKTLRYLRLSYFLPLAAALLIVVLFETDVLAAGGLYGVGGRQGEFVVITALELLTLCVIPLALWLFRWTRIRHALLASPPCLLRYGVLRLALLMVPLLLNVVCYYLFMAAACGYMAIILALASIFIYPTRARCTAETTAANTTEE